MRRANVGLFSELRPRRRRKPMAGLGAVDQYVQTHWGRVPRHARSVEAHALRVPQELVKMGDLRALWLEVSAHEVDVLRPSKPYPALCFGRKDNRLYIVGGSTGTMAARRAWGPVGHSQRILRVDYDAHKGRRRAKVYWYHQHEPPYPRLVILPGGFPAYRGGRYTVAPEGITG